MTPVAALDWADGLYLAAEDWCKEQGPTGATGHVSSTSNPQKRIDNWGGGYTGLAENIAYGSSQADKIIL